MPAERGYGGAGEPSQGSMLAIRDEVFRRFLLVLAASMALAELLLIPVWIENDRVVDIVGGVVGLVVLATIIVIRAPYRVRALAFLVSLSALATALLVLDGLATGPTLLGFSLPFMAVLFLGVRASIGCFVWWVSTIAAVGLMDQWGIYRAAENDTLQRMDPTHWPFLAISQVCIGAPLVFLAHQLISKLGSALEHERDALSNLQRAQEGLAASERHKALALLAGGVAHDLNNTLTVIACHVELARGLPEESRESLLSATSAASQLATQILVSAGERVSQPRAIDVHHHLKPALKGLRGVLPPNVTLTVRPPESRLVVVGDPVLLQQAVLNLAVNARDAMPEGGELTIEISRAEHEGRAWGEIVVRDTGVGMDEATLARATEPFFTTKSMGRGTGLGLANVRSTVEALGGELRIESELGVGTTMRLRFPATDAALLTEESRSDEPSRVHDRTVLLVDDDLRVRAIAFETLERAGYTVLEAGGFEQALELLERCDSLDAAVCDLVLGAKSGLELARRVRQRFPGAGVLVISGYSPSAKDRDALARNEFPFLPKPFRPKQLIEAVHDACEGLARSA